MKCWTACFPSLLAVVLAACAGCEQSSYSSVRPAEEPASAPSEPATPGEPSAPTPVEAKAEAAVDETAAEPKPTEAETAEAPPKEPAAEAKSSLPTKDLTFDDIKFDIEKDGRFERSMITPKIDDLFGRSIRIRGYILPTFQQSGIRNFVLVRDNLECCFGPGAALFDCIVVDMVPGATTDYTTRPVTVEGTFRFKELLDFDGVVRAIYHLDAKTVN